MTEIKQSRQTIKESTITTKLPSQNKLSEHSSKLKQLALKLYYN
jgi:hypothetical protein